LLLLIPRFYFDDDDDDNDNDDDADVDDDADADADDLCNHSDMHIDDDVAHALSEVLKNNTSIINVDLQCLRMIHNDDVDYNANDDDDDDDDD